MEKRKVEVVVISDLHLGTYGCHATELVTYLRNISPKVLILNGDIIDGWQFNKRYFPAIHLQVINEIFNLITAGTEVVYITGNHDEMLRRYSDLKLNNFLLTDKLVLDLDGKKAWIFHGDVFDHTTKGSAKILAVLGGYGYDWLILLNRCVNWCCFKLGRPKVSFSKKVKNKVKKAVSWIADFEQTAAELAIAKKYDFVICGHIHQPQKRIVESAQGKVLYLNSGDWVENLTALEYNNGQWKIHYYKESDYSLTHIFTMHKKVPNINVETGMLQLYMNGLPTKK